MTCLGHVGWSFCNSCICLKMAEWLAYYWLEIKNHCRNLFNIIRIWISCKPTCPRQLDCAEDKWQSTDDSPHWLVACWGSNSDPDHNAAGLLHNNWIKLTENMNMSNIFVSFKHDQLQLFTLVLWTNLKNNLLRLFVD